MQTGFKVKGVASESRLKLCMYPDMGCPYKIKKRYCTTRPYAASADEPFRVVERCTFELDVLKGRRMLTRKQVEAFLDMVPWKWLGEYMALRKVKVDECERVKGEVKE